MNKKGYVQDFLLFGIVLFTVAIIIIAGSRLMTSFNDKWQVTDAGVDAKGIMGDNAGRFTTIWDYAFLSIFVFFVLAIFASFFVLNTHPAFYFVVVILLGFMLIPIAILSNTWDDYSTSTSVASDAAGFNIMDFLLGNWALIFGTLGFLGLVVLFAKFKSAT